MGMNIETSLSIHFICTTTMINYHWKHWNREFSWVLADGMLSDGILADPGS